MTTAEVSPWTVVLSEMAPNLEVFVELNSVGNPQLNVLAIFPLLNITTLTLDINPVGISLRRAFGQLPRLKKVIAVKDCALEVIKELTLKCENYDDTQLSDYYSVTFPALECLSFVKGLFESDTLEILQDCLMERCERNAEILKLEFLDCCELFCSDVKSLREIVVDVEWDEVELVVEYSYNYHYQYSYD